MLFNSFGFLFLFLPVTALGFFGLARISQRLAAGWLAAASLFFYGYWDLTYIPLLLASIGVNYAAGYHIGHTQGARRRITLVLSVGVNLLFLAYFKYADFFLDSVAHLSGADIARLNILLPVGISFFTFTQIAFLVDTYQDKVKEYRFVHYLLFVTYFPHLIAGPVLHHKEMMPQFAADATYRPSSSNLAVGLSIFAIGLAKKVLVADQLAPLAGFVFDNQEQPSLILAWGGVLAYAFQLYFDFSGYSDMAIGLSRIFGIRLPLNFNSPYKAASIIEFWRRWHMTLSRFLRDYLYIALGGNKRGPVRRYGNLMATMVLGGLWHGAGANFVIWGCLHGVYLMINHAWMAICRALDLNTGSRAWNIFSVALTFGAVCVAWVFFRSSDLGHAMTIVRGMFGAYGIGLPSAVGNQLGQLGRLAEQAGVEFYMGGGSRFVQTWSWVATAAVLAFLLPNTQQIMRRFSPALDYVEVPNVQRPTRSLRLTWQPSTGWASAIGLLGVACLLSLSRPAEFLYFQF